MTTPLNARTHDVGPREEPRIVHLGLGAFHRAHQAWYTQLAGDGWGIAAFTGRSPAAAEQLASQDGLYTLIERAADGDRFTVMSSIVEAHDGADLAALCALVARAEVAIVTLTITEAGYHLRPGNAELDVDSPAVAADLEAMRANYDNGAFTLVPGFDGTAVRTAPGRLVVALAARRAADGWPIAVVPCDNLPGNGSATRASILGVAEHVDPVLARWIEENVSFVDSSIDRITPRTTDADRAAVAEATGFADVWPVVTEPFASWVLAGDFPGGRPAWENAGAVVVDEVEPFERRKLWLLNGAHSLMAYAGLLRGHATVSEALGDDVVSGWVEEFWDAAAHHLTHPDLEIPAYRAALRDRFANPRIAHFLAQIAQDGSLKLAARTVPVVLAERAEGRDGTPALRALAAWMDFVAARVAAGEEVVDPSARRLAEAVSAQDPTAAMLAVIDPTLAARDDVVAGIQELRGTTTH